MIAVLSPAKRLLPPTGSAPYLTRPVFLQEAQTLVELLRENSPWQLETLLRANAKLAMEAYLAYQDFDPEAAGSAAMLTFHGLVFDHLAAADFSSEDFDFAQAHLRLCSGLYGLLRPADGILPYRLDLNNKLRIGKKNLYAFWGKKIYQSLFETGEVILNLASGEYSRSFLPYLRPQDRVVNCVFLTYKRGKLATIVTDAKAARGEMARMMIKERITDAQDLRHFCWNGFAYSETRSTDQTMVFIRDGSPAAFFNGET